ncbi:hypothetical protein [Priestia megaterium]|uniref:hypothetical protein n=1 Tax=Priestia megaterium TaxID=1404 RepID=UPI003672ADF9
MSDKGPTHINDLLSGVLDFTNTQKRISEQLELMKKPMVIGYPKQYKVTDFNAVEAFNSFKKLGELMRTADIKAQPFLDAGIIQHREALSLAIRNATRSLSGQFIINMPFITQLKMADSIITMREGFKNIPNYGEILKKAAFVSVPYTSLYKDIFDTFNKEEFLKAFAIDVDEPSAEDIQAFTEYQETDDADVKIVREEFVQASEKLATCMNITNQYFHQTVVHNHYATPEIAETQSFWQKHGKVILFRIFQVINTIGWMTDPVDDTVYMETFNKIVHTIETYPVEQHDIKIDLDALNKFDSVDSEKSSS